MNIHEKYMSRCIQLARNGLKTARPNPSVGCVIVHSGRIIGEGFTSPYGGNHGEVNAIQAVADTSQLSKSTLYVSLEPCSHFGKTPPCSDLIIAKGIKKVVIGTTDPHSKVAGKGIKKLMEVGCDVTMGVLEEACREVNKRFFCFHEKKRPYIILKWAQSADGYLSPRQQDKREPVWITNTTSRQLVHKWRTEEQAILVGTTTVEKDDPSLTARDWAGENPLRVVLDRRGRLPKDSRVFDGEVGTLVLTENENEYLAMGDSGALKKALTFVRVTWGTKELVSEICKVLVERGIQSLLVEGGSQTLQTFLDAGIWDEARIFTGEVSLGGGVEAPRPRGNLIRTERFLGDVLRFYGGINPSAAEAAPPLE